VARCEVCGNEYDNAFTVTMSGKSHVFDSFECAINRLAPRCSHCDCLIIGHGVQAGGNVYCCAHCSRTDGVHSIVDRAQSADA